MKKLLSLMALTLGAAQAQAPQMQKISDLSQVLGLLSGQVDLYGDQIGSVPFQRGILTLAQSKKITVRVLTSTNSAANMKPLKAVGAQVYVLPTKITGAMVIVRNKAAIFPVQGGYNVLLGATEANQVQLLMEQYWKAAKPY